MFRAFDEDPFFAELKQGRGDMLGEMNMPMLGEMSTLMDNMPSMMRPGANEVTEGRRAGVRRPERPDLFSGLMMSNMGSLLPKMGKLSMDVEEMMKESQSGHSFSSSQVYSYRSDGKNPPQEFQAVSSTARAPGGVKEVKKGYKDSTTRTHKMQYGRHIGDTGIVQERKQVREKREEKTDYQGLQEAQAQSFEQEWQKKAPIYAKAVQGRESEALGTKRDTRRRTSDLRPIM